MRYGELWLLEVVAAAHPLDDGWIPFWPLAKDDPGSYLNFPAHHLPYELLLKELVRLFADGDLIASDQESHHNATRFFTPTPRQIESALQEGRTAPWLCYTMTPQGLSRWERYAEPDWTCYRGGVQGWGRGQPVAATAETFGVARRWIEYLCEGDIVHWSNATCLLIRPWRVLPFKRLECGVRVVVSTTAVEPGPLDPTVDWCARERVRERLLEGIHPWYRHGVLTWDADREYRQALG